MRFVGERVRDTEIRRVFARRQEIGKQVRRDYDFDVVRRVVTARDRPGNHFGQVEPFDVGFEDHFPRHLRRRLVVQRIRKRRDVAEALAVCPGGLQTDRWFERQWLAQIKNDGAAVRVPVDVVGHGDFGDVARAAYDAESRLIVRDVRWHRDPREVGQGDRIDRILPTPAADRPRARVSVGVPVLHPLTDIARRIVQCVSVFRINCFGFVVFVVQEVGPVVEPLGRCTVHVGVAAGLERVAAVQVVAIDRRERIAPESVERAEDRETVGVDTFSRRRLEPLVVCVRRVGGRIDVARTVVHRQPIADRCSYQVAALGVRQIADRPVGIADRDRVPTGRVARFRVGADRLAQPLRWKRRPPIAVFHRAVPRDSDDGVRAEPRFDDVLHAVEVGTTDRRIEHEHRDRRRRCVGALRSRLHVAYVHVAGIGVVIHELPAGVGRVGQGVVQKRHELVIRNFTVAHPEIVRRTIPLGMVAGHEHETFRRRGRDQQLIHLVAQHEGQLHATGAIEAGRAIGPVRWGNELRRDALDREPIRANRDIDIVQRIRAVVHQDERRSDERRAADRIEHVRTHDGSGRPDLIDVLNDRETNRFDALCNTKTQEGKRPVRGQRIARCVLEFIQIRGQPEVSPAAEPLRRRAVIVTFMDPLGHVARKIVQVVTVFGV